MKESIHSESYKSDQVQFRNESNLIQYYNIKQKQRT